MGSRVRFLQREEPEKGGQWQQESRAGLKGQRQGLKGEGRENTHMFLQTLLKAAHQGFESSTGVILGFSHFCGEQG